MHRDLNLSKTLLEKIYDYFSNEYQLPIRLNFAGGEPFLVKNLISLIEIAKKIGFSVSFISNGSFISKEIANKICDNIDLAAFSIDSNDSKIDQKNRENE